MLFVNQRIHISQNSATRELIDVITREKVFQFTQDDRRFMRTRVLGGKQFL